MPFLTLTAVFLFIGPVLIIGIATMWSNLKQKISNELSARVIKILIDLGILNNIPGKRSLHDQISTELNDKFDTCISDINSIFTEKLDRINNDLNNKLTAENKARDDDFTKETQKIFSMISTVTERLDRIEEACHNDFGNISSEFTSIKASIEILQNDLAQRYAVVQRANFDQQSVFNESETNESELGSSLNSASASTSSSSSSEGSNLSGIFDITGDIRIRFKQHFDRLMKARNYTSDEMFISVAVDIRGLGGNIKISTVKNFYSGVGRSTVSTVNQINAWVASFNNNAE
ncbi:hypothetical protein RhiirA1_503640 [Rhizophagus irregularis]|uniref:Uncharacterized protein n=1 Tax=Rhizophagus irregularis TaxID=588596 RepID=A0A2N0QWG6_9GLOM|nr:hypothetical protein RhiirA1_503640 [Rhizophagus irregularis]